MVSRILTGCCLLIGWSIAEVSGAEQPDLDAPLQVVQLGPGDTLRSVVGEHLGDPDLWPVVLRLNGVASAAQVTTGSSLKLPVQQVAAADNALFLSLQAIQNANAEGAGIFAPREIGSAIENREAAVSQREEGAWRKVVDFALVATEFANEALEISLAQRDRSAEAVISDVHGDVEGRAPNEPSWNSRDQSDILVEFERLRTLSNSTTQVTFRDLSRLRLNANSNATIQRMRSDPLTGGEVTKVSLVTGDFYALLNQLSDNNNFEIETPGIDGTTNSGAFWIKSDDSGARFVNYDDKALEIERDGETISVEENEGVVLETRQAAQKVDVLASPILQQPAVGEAIYSASTALNWDPLDGAEGYWLEVATDAGFNSMALSQWGLRETTFEAELGPARYYWRVAAVDRLGLPGSWSTSRDFTVREDSTPPYLALLAPADATMVSSPRVEILGVTEPAAVVTLNGAPVELSGDGGFLTSVDLARGENTITLAALDLAGNTTTRSVTVTYRPQAAVRIALSPDIPRVGEALATSTTEMSLRGTTDAEPEAPIALLDAAGVTLAQTRVDAAGAFSLTVPVDTAVQAFTLQVRAPDGSVEGKLAFSALQDDVAPEVTFDSPPPNAVDDDSIVLTGDAGDAVSLELDGRAIAISERRFALELDLVPGDNLFELTARDAVGNATLRRIQTLLDLDPPDISQITLERQQGAEGPISLIVQASDASGLVQAAPFVVSVGGAEVDGFLRCDSATGTCRGTIPAQEGDLRLIELMIEDYAGNAAFK